MSWEKKRITIVTKAYPEHSKRHGTVACTAGITEDGKWIRLYPIDIRHFIGPLKISKWDVIEVYCQQDRDKLGRIESYKVNQETIKIIDSDLSRPKADWVRRNSIILPKLNSSIQELRELYESDRRSLGLIKPSEYLDLIKTEELQTYEKAGWSSTVTLDGQRIPTVTKIPHIFKYEFKCGCCSEKYHTMQCEDWELFESYRSWGLRYKDTDELWDKLKEKYFYWMLAKRDLYFIMGMYSQYPTWFIIGIYYPPKS